MSKPKRKRKKHGHGSGQPVPDQSEAVLVGLQAKADEISQSQGETPGAVWGAIHQLLLKTDTDSSEAASIIASRDIDGLHRAIRKLRGLEVEPANDKPKKVAAEIPHETLRTALRAFRKRMKLIRLDHESKLGVGPMSSGKKADFDAILPPNDFSRAVWQALVAKGKLKNAGQGFYMLCDTSKKSWD